MEVESDEEDEKQEKSEEPPSQLDQDTQVQDMDEVSSWEGQWEDFFPGGSCRRWSLEKGPWAPGKAVLAKMLPKFRSTESLSNSSNKDVFIGEDLKAGHPHPVALLFAQRSCPHHPHTNSQRGIRCTTGLGTFKLHPEDQYFPKLGRGCLCLCWTTT